MATWPAPWAAPPRVGQACGANPFPFWCPATGRGPAAIGGFAHARGGFLIDTKQWLIQHEQQR
ncbi:MAG: hypothetical protein R3E34_03195 [Rhodocyclaceae bacterium]